MKHAITIGPSAAVTADADGRALWLPEARSATYRARCACGWRSQERATAEQATTDGDVHVRLMESTGEPT